MFILQLVNGFRSAATVPGVSNPDVMLRINNDTRSQLELKCCKFDTYKYLVVEQKCSAHCEDNDGQTPLHYACASGQFDIVKHLHREKLRDLVHTTHSGDTPLHIACKYSQIEIRM